MRNNEVKMMLLGESEVGKTTLICKQKGNNTKSSNPTIGSKLFIYFNMNKYIF